MACLLRIQRPGHLVDVEGEARDEKGWVDPEEVNTKFTNENEGEFLRTRGQIEAIWKHSSGESA